jgi:hypothetical protein
MESSVMNRNDSGAAAQIAERILQCCASRAPTGSICPSEVARALWPEGWREKMDAVRAVACALARDGQIEITQRGLVIDPDMLRGAIRLRLRRSAQ